MQLVSQYLFNTAEGLALLALFTLAPIAFTAMSIKSIKPVHVWINVGLAILFAVPAGVSASLVKAGDGMGGLLFLLIACGSAGLALAFFAGALSTFAVLALRGESQSMTRRKTPAAHRRKPSSAPLSEQFSQWKADHYRPRASYQEFLDEAHPRYFPASTRVWIVVALLIGFIAYLVLQ